MRKFSITSFLLAWKLLVALNFILQALSDDCIQLTKFPVLPTTYDDSICIITRQTSNIESYGNFSLFIQRFYAFYHGYRLIVETDASHENVPMQDDYRYYPKLSYLLRVMQDKQFACNFVAWMDADFIPLDIAHSLRDVMEKQGFLEFFASRDVSNLINTGSLLIRNSDWSRRLLTKWIMLRFKEEAINDQSGFDILYREYLDDEDKQKIAILDIREFNSAAPAMTQQGINDKFLHLAAEDDEFRRVVFSTAASSLCTAILSQSVDFESLDLSQKIPLQLNVTRSVLLQLGLTTYNDLKVRTHETISSLLNSTAMDSVSSLPLEILVPLLSKYRTVASKFLHAYASNWTTNGKDNVPTLLQRWQLVLFYTDVVDALVVAATQNARDEWSTSWDKFVIALQRSTRSYTSTYTIHRSMVVSYNAVYHQFPELLKLLLEVSYEFLLHSEDIFPDSKLYAGISMFIHNDTHYELLRAIDFTRKTLMPKLLDLLRSIVHPQQRYIVDKMIQDFSSSA